MRYAVSIFLIAFCSLAGYAQSIYNYTHGNSFYNEFISKMGFESIIENSDGNLVGITAGTTLRMVEKDGEEIFTVPLDLELSSTYSFINQIIQASDGSYYGVGQVGTGNADGFAFKVDQYFQVEWVRTISGSKTESLDAVWELPDGDIMVIGWTLSDIPEVDSTNTSKDLFMIRYNTNGENVFSKKIGAVTEKWTLEQYYSAGPISDTAFAITLKVRWFDASTGNTQGYEPHVLFLNNEGETLSYSSVGLVSRTFGTRSVQTDNLGYIYLFGRNTISKFNPNLVMEWERSTDLVIYEGLVNDKGYLLTGYTTSLTGDFEYPYDFTAKTTENRYAWVAQYDSFGNMLFKFRPGKPGDYWDTFVVAEPYGLYQSDEGNVYTSLDGNLVIMYPCNMSVDFSYMEHQTGIDFTDESTGSIALWEWDLGDGSTSGSMNPSRAYASPGNYNVCLTVTSADFCRLEKCKAVPFQTMSVNELYTDDLYRVYPNPTHQKIVTLENAVLGDLVEVYDYSGRIVATWNYDVTGLNLESLPEGMYELVVNRSGRTSLTIVK